MPEIRNDGVRISYDVAGEGSDRFAIQGQSYGGWIAWMTAAAAPERIPAMVSSGSWDPRPLHEEPTETEEWDVAVRNGGTRTLVDLFKNEDGAAARAAVQQARGFPTLATPGPALIA